MEQSGISEEEVSICLRQGTLIIKQLVKREMRYGKQIDLKWKRIIVIYALQNQEEKVITVYPVRRKKEW